VQMSQQLLKVRARSHTYAHTLTQPLDEKKLENSVRNAANVAAFAAGDSMTEKYKKAASMQVLLFLLFLLFSTHIPRVFALEQRWARRAACGVLVQPSRRTLVKAGPGN
jgi:hypothetical protein